MTYSRREFLQQAGLQLAAGGALLGLAGGVGQGLMGPAMLPAARAADRTRPRIAAIFTELRFRSHAYNILENFFEPYLFRGELVDPGVEVVSFYADQFPENDLAREIARRYKIPIYDSIGGALRCGGDRLAVDGVLSIVEHGEYPDNELGQKMYPRKRFFDESLAVMQEAGRFVPFFNDKHLSYRGDWAQQMFDASRRHRFPLMAGSSVPLASRVPPLELPEQAEFLDAVVVHGGGAEVYDFHGLEILQSLIEARRGGESGIASIEFLEGERLRAAEASGAIDEKLWRAAMAAETGLSQRRQPRPLALQQLVRGPSPPDDPSQVVHALRVEYRDGARAWVLKVGHDSNRWNFACRLKGEDEPRATAYFNSPWGNRGLFKALSHAIQHLFRTGQEPYPVERTLLVSGALEAAMKSRAKQAPIETPELAVAYQPVDFRRFRENGASWQRITRDVPQPTDFSPGDAKLLG